MRRTPSGRLPRGTAGLDENGLDDLLKWADRVGVEPEPEPEVVVGTPSQPADGSGTLALGAQPGQLGQPPTGRGSMPAISRLPPREGPEPALDAFGRPLSALEQGIITSAEPAPKQVELPEAIGKSWWTADSVVTRCEMPGCAQVFGKRVRRHHCRKCGKCVCKDCSDYKLMLRHPTEKARSKQVSHDRVCGACYVEFKQYSTATLGPDGVRISDSGTVSGGVGSPQTSAGAATRSPAGSVKPAQEIDWSDVAEEKDAQAASRMLRSGRAY